MLPARSPAPAPADAAEVRGRRGRAHQPRGEREVQAARRRQHSVGAAALQVSSQVDAKLNLRSKNLF